jgi:hypothetical protein
MQIPFFQKAYGNKCGWVSVLTVLYPGFFIGYCLRYDESKKIYVY